MDVFNKIFSTNETRQPTGTITRTGLGSIPLQEDTTYEKKTQLLPAFFQFHGGGYALPVKVEIEHGGIDNVREVQLLTVKLTGLNPALDVVGIRFLSFFKNEEYYQS